jgi:predicted O-methyltransferase YrrM
MCFKMADIVSHPEAYFEALMPDRDGLLRDLEAEAAAEEIPIVGPVLGELLFVLVRATQATHILELGAATGYSAIYLARACEPPGGRVVTFEYDTAMAERARQNIEQAGLSTTVSVREGNALAQLGQLDGPFDFVFMDIEKEDYHKAVKGLEPIVRPSGLLVADNTGFKDADPFNRMMHANPAWRSVQLFSFLPMHSGIYDGLCLAVRI